MDNEYFEFADTFPFADRLKGKTFLITGATGLIGSSLVGCLSEMNKTRGTDIKIICLVRNVLKANQILPHDVSIVEYDVEKIDLSHIDYIVHGASPTSSKYFVDHPVETLSTALSLTIQLLEKLKGCKNILGMVYLSSMECYGIVEKGIQVTEDLQGYINPLEARSSYSMGKRVCELLCYSYYKEYGIPVRIARLAQTISRRVTAEDTRVFAQFARSIVHDEDIVLHTMGNSSRPFIYTLDVVSAILYLLIFGVDGSAYNVANKESYISIKDLAHSLCRTFGKRCKVRYELNDNMGYAPETFLNLNTDKLEGLGWKCRFDLHEMFENLINELK